jgi:hypothetical protein
MTFLRWVDRVLSIILRLQALPEALVHPAQADPGGFQAGIYTFSSIFPS